MVSLRAALVIAALTVTATVVLARLEFLGLLPTTFQSTPAMHAGDQIVVYLCCATLVVYLVRAYRNRVTELGRVGNDLAHRSSDLQDSKAELQRAQAVAKVGNWVFDIAAGSIRLSAETCRIFGLPAGTTGSHDAYLARVHPDDRSAVERAWQAACKGHPFDSEHRFLVAGLSRWVRLKAEFEFSADGRALSAVGIAQDIDERRIAEEKINELAYFDPLTHLPNRRLLLDRLKRAMAVSNRQQTYCAVLFIDLDHFKTLNDSQGHDMGDLLLQQVAQRLLDGVREVDTVARLGGDEFVVVLERLSNNAQEAATEVGATGHKILSLLKLMYQLGDMQYRCTASMGAILFLGNGTSIDELLKQADLAMYQAKDTGRDALRFFDIAMQTVVLERAALDADLREAIQNRQFVLHYQAQWVDEARIVGAEALLRWSHPLRGLVSPGEFIAQAEESGLILPLGRWVLESACAQLALWAGTAGMAQFTLAVNVSALQFRQPDFVAQVLQILEHSGANPHRLKLELTESLLADNVPDVIEKMTTLKRVGVGFSLDDFGTGYSSLSYLKRLPLDQLKIDQSFVRDVLKDPNDAAIVKTIVALADSLGLGVIAEGVETQGQRDFLVQCGCHAYQGYLFSRPVVLKDFEELVLGKR
jgi:diguanylate cyclase (GGDEF)-like protein